MNENADSTVLITGANGEVGHGLLKKLSTYAKSSADKKNSKLKIIAFDLNELDPILKGYVDVFIKGNITDRNLINKIFTEYNIDTIFHLAALLSTSGEKNPELAQDVNVGGTFNLLSEANSVADKEKRVIKFIFPSSIAVYGMPNLKVKIQKAKVTEEEFLNPITIYGINKLYCEQLGGYFSKYYSQLTINMHYLDFRCVRFPGLISSDTMPSGGTSDYAPEMLHAAAQGKEYACFVRPDSTIHFMAMPDAIDALLQLTAIPKNKLSRLVYNIRGFSASAKQIEDLIKKYFPKSKITYKINPERQRIIDSWSENVIVDDSKAVKDWGWKSKYDFQKAFEDYLIPSISKKYS